MGVFLGGYVLYGWLCYFFIFCCFSRFELYVVLWVWFRRDVSLDFLRYIRNIYIDLDLQRYIFICIYTFRFEEVRVCLEFQEFVYIELQLRDLQKQKLVYTYVVFQMYSLYICVQSFKNIYSSFWIYRCLFVQSYSGACLYTCFVVQRCIYGVF